MPILNLAEEIAKYMPGAHQDTGANSRIGGIATAGVVGGILGSLLGGDS